ncbi:unnamed protein product [Rotaria sp. Silwood1]|nr:unnamed protein product [Rotaria sp. Silwood1]CAF3651620.1 unnamed protein product [Rotaria sp. Silwood1]
MVQTRQQVKREEEIDQEFQRLSGIEIEQTTYQQNNEHIVYRPISFTMTEKLINTILSNNLDKLPKFGGKSNENVNKWLTDITNELNMVKLNDQQKLSVIQTFLVDDARRWFINNMSMMTDWSTFSIQLQKTFSSILHQELALKQVGSRQQGLNETVLHYYNEMMELFDMIDLNMNEQYKVAYLKAGLKISLKKEVMRRDPKTAAQFLELAQAEEKLDLSLNIQMDNLQLSNFDSLAAIKPSIKVDPPQQRKPYQSSSKFRCYRLGANDGTALANLHHPSLIFISTCINNMKLCAMIDTGATSSLITMSTITKLNYQDRIHPQTGEITLGDSKTKIIQYGWICLNLKIKNLNCQIRAIIVDCLSTNFILGMDFLRKYKIEIKTMQQCLIIHHQHQQLYVKFEKSNSVRLAQQCTILPRCKAVVNAVVSNIIHSNKMLLNVINEKTQQYKRIRLCDGLVNVKNNNLQLTIYNPTTRIVTLPKSMLLGTVDHLTPNVYCSTLSSNSTIQHIDLTHETEKKSIEVADIITALTQHLQANQLYYQQVRDLLQNHSILFDTSKPRTIKTTVHHVINTGNHSPVNAKPYFKTIEQRKNAQQEIDKMLKAGIIIPSHSPWSSPVVLLKKPNGEFRFIIDYRKLNSITKKDSYPQPTVEELIQRLGGHSWFTKLDLKSGYYQIPIHQADKEKTAFVTQDGLYQFEVLPMGLMNAPPTFQRIMNNIIGYKRWDYILVYLDDILVFSKSFDNHIKHLQELFDILAEHQFTLNPSKCSIAKQSIEFLSHTITKDSIIPSKERIQAILDIPQPTSLAQANKFIGKIGWYRKFIPNFAQIAAPIHKVTNKTRNKKQEFYWSEDQIQSANKLKQILTEEPLVLKYPHPTAPFILSTDASEYAIGGTLKQNINGQIHYNYYLSRLLTTTERKYPTIDREALAIFWCMEKLQQYLGGRDVTIISDHKPLEQFHKKTKLNSKRIDQWLLKHQEIIPQITAVIYRKGRNHGDADAMSRPDIDDHQNLLNATTRSMTRRNQHQSPNNDSIKSTSLNDEKQFISLPMTFNFSLERISHEQKHDPEISLLRQQILHKLGANKNYVLENDVLYKLIQLPHTYTKTKVVYIPLTMREEVIRCYHDHPTAAHFGVTRTWSKIRTTCYWSCMKKSIEDYIKSCEKCAKFNIRRIAPPGHLHSIEYPQGPLELVSMDFWGPTPQFSANGNKYVLVITDYYTRYVVACPLPNNTATSTAKSFVEQFIFKFGIPRRLITDQGVHFNNELIKNLTALLGTHHIQTSAYHPQANGLVERFNATFHPQLSKLYDTELNNWDDYLAPVIYAYNTGIQSTIGYSPFQLMFGRHPILPLNHTPSTFTFARPYDYWIKLLKCMKIYRHVATQKTLFHQQQSKQRFDRNRQDPQFEINDLVFCKVPGHRAKFEERFSGPYTIINKQHPSYTIQNTHSLISKRVHIELYAYLFTTLGETCVIFGAGPIGLLCLQAAMAAGAARTVVVDIAEKRLEKARELGATLIINGKEENISQQIKTFTGGLGADVYLDAAGVQSTFTTGIASLRNGGRAILVAIFGKPVALDAMDLVMREITIKGIVCYRHIFPEVIKLIDSKQMDVERLITRKIKLNDIVKDGFEALVSDPSEIKILIDIGSN